MCDFISWIEVKKKNKINYLYIDDTCLKDKVFRQLIREGSKDNDIIGHSFIREYFGLNSGDGIEREHRNFWNYKEYPNEIADKLKNFDKYFKTIFSTYLQNDDLRYIIYNGTEKYKSLAWKQLLTQSPSNDDLKYIIYNGTEKYKSLAWKQLEKRSW